MQRSNQKDLLDPVSEEEIKHLGGPLLGSTSCHKSLPNSPLHSPLVDPVIKEVKKTPGEQKNNNPASSEATTCTDSHLPLTPTLPPKPPHPTPPPNALSYTVSKPQEPNNIDDVSPTPPSLPPKPPNRPPSFRIQPSHSSKSITVPKQKYDDNSRKRCVTLPSQPLPPRPLPCLLESGNHKGMTQEHKVKDVCVPVVNDVYESIQVAKRQQLSEIVGDSSILPIRVSFCDSIYGLCDSFSFLNSELFDILFVKETQFASVQTSTCSTPLKIPLQAPFKFALDYLSVSGLICYADYKVSKLLKATYLPKVVVVKDGCGSGRLKLRNKSSPFVKGEALVIQGRIKSSTIECVSLLCNGEKKRIHKSSEILLTINPSQLMIDFDDLKYFNQYLPLQVHIISMLGKFQSVFSNVSTIVGLIKEKSVIAMFSNAVIEDDDDISGVKLYEIFIDVPIDFETAKLLPPEKDKLIKRCKTVYDKFSPVKVSLVISNSGNNRLQKEFDKTLQAADGSNRWTQSVEIYQPTNFEMKSGTEIISSPTPAPNATNEVPTTSGNTCAQYEDLDLFRLVSSEYTSLVHSTSNRQSTTPIAESLAVDLVDAASMDSPCSMQQLQENDTGLKLADLTCDQVIDLLHKLGLSKYVESFIAEDISGELLKELDEEMLEQDLGITSKLHRMKLKRVIDGRDSLDNLFKK